MQAPGGFHYRSDFITAAEEAELLEAIEQISFASFEMRGVVARRRVAFYGQAYDANREPLGPIPAFLRPLRERLATWVQVEPDAFAMSLINEYPPGAPIGWHRDAPQYDVVTGVSLLSPCRMRFRPYVRPGTAVPIGAPRRVATHEIRLEPRSTYLMSGESRAAFEHHIPAVPHLRYSITFRTLRS
jgi:alkylated DNA repair dioxygenase AlkB